MPRQTNKAKAESLFIRADHREEHGDQRSAFRLMLAAAKLRDIGAQVNVGNYYGTGKGVRQDRRAAMYWYKRAYRRGCSAAAHNIGTMWRDDQCFGRAMYWFQRALSINGGDDGEASFEIAKLYLHQQRGRSSAIKYLRKVCKSKNVTEACLEESKRLLKQLNTGQLT